MINTIETMIIDNNLNYLFYKINDMEKRINRYKDYQFFLENKFMKNELTLEEMNTVLSFLENTNLSLDEMKNVIKS